MARCGGLSWGMPDSQQTRRPRRVPRTILVSSELWNTYRDLAIAVGVSRADLVRRALFEFAEEQRIALAADEIAVREFTEPDDQGDPWVRPTRADDQPSWGKHRADADDGGTPDYGDDWPVLP